MFRTPPQSVKMVITRNTARKERENNPDEPSTSQSPLDQPTSHAASLKRTSKTKAMARSSMHAQIAKLELQAAEEKARIQMELIDKRLAANLADLEDEMSDRQDSHAQSVADVEQWLESSQPELEKAQSVHDYGIKKGELCQPVAPCPGTQDGALQVLASAIKDLAAASANTNANLLSRISTPRNLPLFSGDPMEWLQLKHAYEESTELCKFSLKENLWRLRKCLRGPAKDAVSALLITATDSKIVMAALELRFGNPDSIVMKIIQDLKKLHPMSQEYQKDIVPFSLKVQNFIEAVRSVKRDEYLQGMNIVSLILSKLPTVLISKWSDYSFPLITEGKKSRMDILADFLKDEAVKISTTANIHTYSSHTNVKGTHSSRAQDTVLLTTDTNDSKCLYCRISKHNLTDCKRFKKSLRKDRWRHVKRHGICYKCLLSRHDRDTCPAAVCDIDNCGQSHHPLLHYVSKHNRPQTDVTITDITESETVTNINLTRCKVLLKTVPIDIHGPDGVVSTSALLDDGSTVSLISHELAKQIGLHGQKQTIRVCGAWTDNILECDSEIVDFNISNKDGSKFEIRARIMKDLNLPVHDLTTIDPSRYEHSVPDIKNYFYNTNIFKPQLLIGQDNYNLMLPLQTIRDKANGLFITRTALGIRPSCNCVVYTYVSMLDH